MAAWHDSGTGCSRAVRLRPNEKPAAKASFGTVCLAVQALAARCSERAGGRGSFLPRICSTASEPARPRTRAVDGSSTLIRFQRRRHTRPARSAYRRLPRGWRAAQRRQAGCRRVHGSCLVDGLRDGRFDETGLSGSAHVGSDCLGPAWSSFQTAKSMVREVLERERRGMAGEKGRGRPLSHEARATETVAECR